ncbi:MAG TPA: arsenate reductase family protein [Caulobacteraceae bacterium]|nr:arsenate reductase family protein [Caulobacteraceae bacterium]
MAKDGVTIFHNPNCGTSRTVLAALRERGLEPKVVEYLKVGWTKPQLEGLLAAMKAKPRDLLRMREEKAKALAAGASDAAILAAMVADPILVERPIVVTPKGAALCRPADRLDALL